MKQDKQDPRQIAPLESDSPSLESDPLDSDPGVHPDAAEDHLQDDGQSDSVANSGDTADVATHLTGHHLDHYRLQDRLGGGVVSAVFRAVDERNGAAVALKTLLPGADEVMRERFRREAGLVSKLHHAHIVRTQEIGEASAAGLYGDGPYVEGVNGEPASVAYIVMELVDGSSLAQLLERHGRLSASDAAVILAPIAQALDYAHGHDIVHRDVKPSNILLRREEGNPPGSVRISALDHAVTPLLTDFGIARALDAPELTNAGRTIGTPAFMSPEQCAGEEDLDGRSDIYGLGAVFFRCVVGKTPYSGSTTQMLYAHVYEPLLIPDDLVALLPPIALSTLQRAMMKDPSHRYPNAGAMAADLTVASGRIETSAEPPAGNHTVTMPALPAVRREGQAQTSRVLVPVAPVPVGNVLIGNDPVGNVARPPIPPERGRATVKLETAIPRVPDARRTPSPVRPPRRRFLQRRPWGQTLATIAAAVLLVLAGTGVLAWMVWSQGFNLLPDVQTSSPSSAATPSAATPSVATSSATDVAAVAPEPGSVPATSTTSTPQTDAAPGAASSATGPADAGGTPQTGTGDSEADPGATPEPPAIPLATAWETAQEAFAAEEWVDARDWLLIVRRINADHETARVHGMLQRAYLELAQRAYDDQELEAALEWLVRAAQEDRGDNAVELAQRLDAAYVAYLEAQANATPEASDDEDTQDTEAGDAPDQESNEPTNEAHTEELRAALADVADAIAARSPGAAEAESDATSPGSTTAGAATTDAITTEVGTDADPSASVADDAGADDTLPPLDVCTAALYGSVAVALGDANAAGTNPEVESPWLANLVQACNTLRGVPTAPTPSGRLLYSSQEGDDYRIYSMPFAAPTSSSLLVDNAAQPRLGPSGAYIAFYSWQRDAQGLRGLDLTTGQNPEARSVTYTNFVEDSRDSPPSWSPGGDQLAFSSTRFNDGRHRVYITSADGNQDARELHIGRDPAWHPWLDWIVFNGVDDAGGNPGLWMIRADGSDLRQLTDNGNDLRPIWTPDGSAIVFMSSGRHGNWELYRLDLQTGAISRLTFSDAQDGLPAVSPDGRLVVFASDRAGFWEFWYVPLAGGESTRLSSMNGQLVSWLEHGLQWIP